MTSSVPAQVAKLLEPELSTRMYRVSSAFNEALYSAANEPSLGMYRIQEHVAVAVPRLVEQKRNLQEACQQVEGTCYDLEYDTQTLKDARNITQFAGIKNSLLKAIQLKRQLDEAQTRPHPLPPQTSLQPQRPTSIPSPASHQSLPPFFPAKSPPTEFPIGINSPGGSRDTQQEKDMHLQPKSFD